MNMRFDFGMRVTGQALVAWSAFRRTFWIVTVIAGLAFAGQALAMGQGGGKPPKDDPPPASFDPVIVYTKAGKGKKVELVVTDANGENAATVLSLSSSSINHASWSADGTTLAVEGTIDNVRGIYRLDLFDAGVFAPGEPSLITIVNGSLSGFLAWSPVPDSQGNFWIAYSDVADPDDPLNKDIYLVNPEPPHQKFRLTNSLGTTELDPTWSPDGTRLAIVSTPANQSNSPRDVVILDIDFSGSVPTTIGSPTSLIQGNTNPFLEAQEWRWPDWANTGDVLVLINTTDDQIWALPTDPALVAGDAASLTNDISGDVFRSRPGWSPNDSQLIFDRQGIGGECSLGSREPRKVVIADLDDPAMPTSLAICPGNSGEIGEGRHADWWRG